MIVSSMLFFLSKNLIVIFVLIELSTYVIFILLLYFGYIVEKVTSSWYIIIFGVSTRIRLLFRILFLKVAFLYRIFLRGLIVFIFLVSFLIKLPVIPLHLWLPKVHVESPTYGRVLLAAILLKLGGWGFLIISSFHIKIILFFLVFIGVVCCISYCIHQSDGKSLVAFSSIVHMSIFLLFFSSCTNLGFYSSILILFSHGVVSAIIFLFMGIMYYTLLSRKIFYHRGLNPIFISFIIFYYFLTNGGVPPTISFILEVYGLLRIYKINNLLLLILFLYFILGFYYTLSYGISMFSGKNVGPTLFINKSKISFIIVCLMGVFSMEDLV